VNLVEGSAFLNKLKNSEIEMHDIEEVNFLEKNFLKVKLIGNHSRV